MSLEKNRKKQIKEIKYLRNRIIGHDTDQSISILLVRTEKQMPINAEMCFALFHNEDLLKDLCDMVDEIEEVVRGYRPIHSAICGGGIWSTK